MPSEVKRDHADFRDLQTEIRTSILASAETDILALRPIVKNWT